MALPDNLVGEIVDGELYTRPRPAGPYALAEIGLSLELGGAFGKGRCGPGGWWILPEPELHLVRDVEVVVPDIAGWRRERMPAVPEDHRFEVVPDWVCEILSPHTVKKDRAIKLPLYARRGVAHAWLVDPQVRTLEGFALRDGSWLLLGTYKDDDPIWLALFDAVTFSLAELWT